MFKPIPGNHRYVICLSGQIRKRYGELHDLTIDGNFVSIELYGKLEKLDIYWLALIAHFEINLENHYKSIEFVDYHHYLTKSNSGKVMKLKAPMTTNKKYRLIPNYPNYAVSKHGIVLDIKHQHELIVDLTRVYPYVHLYDPDKCFFKDTAVHRLVALAWLTNDDYVNKSVVNHKDGNKQNYHADNLEWCTAVENLDHAKDTGLIKQTQYKARDVETGQIKTYSSFNEFCAENGLDTKLKYVKKQYKTSRSLIAGKFEVKKDDDDTPWIMEKDSQVRRNKYTIIITFPDGDVETFSKITDVMTRLTIWNISYNIKEIIKVAEVKYPGIKIDVVENFLTKAVQALNTLTGEVIEAETIRKMSLLTETAFSTIQKAVNRDEKHVNNGYVFRFKSDDPWPETPVRHGNVATPIFAKNNRTGETIIFPSMKIMQNELGISSFVVRNRIVNKMSIGDWTLSKV